MTWTDSDTFHLRQGGQYNGSPQNILADKAADEIERLHMMLKRIARYALRAGGATEPEPQFVDTGDGPPIEL